MEEKTLQTPVRVEMARRKEKFSIKVKDGAQEREFSVEGEIGEDPPDEVVRLLASICESGSQEGACAMLADVLPYLDREPKIPGTEIKLVLAKDPITGDPWGSLECWSQGSIVEFLSFPLGKGWNQGWYKTCRSFLGRYLQRTG